MNRIRTMLTGVILLLGSLVLNAQKTVKELPEADLSFIIANDLGRNGYYDQKPIAELMGQTAEITGPEAVLALGDIHHFEGVRSAADPLWMTNYELIYSHPELMLDWFAILGNHEYRGCTQAVLDYSAVSRRWAMPSRYYSRTFSGGGTSVRVVFIDTTPIIDKYRNDSTEYPDARREDLDRQLEWLDKTLESADEDWVIVAGHHPVYADTPKNGSERTDMQNRVGKLLGKHRVDMYICGHIHNFQHIRPKGSYTDYIVNSSASLSRPKVSPVEGTVFCSGAPGFSVLTADKGTLCLSMVDKDGNIIHEVTRKKQ